MDKLELMNLLDRVATILYNLEGDEYQVLYEELETMINELKEQSA
jgi:hypothetical protein